MKNPIYTFLLMILFEYNQLKNFKTVSQWLWNKLCSYAVPSVLSRITIILLHQEIRFFKPTKGANA